MTKLRKAARENNVYLHVVRNTLLSRAVEGTEFECMKDQFKGPTLIRCCCSSVQGICQAKRQVLDQGFSL